MTKLEGAVEGIMGKIVAEKRGNVGGSCSICSAQLIRWIIKGL